MADAFSDFGTAIGDFYAAAGDRKSAKNYLQAADLANTNASLEKMSVAIQTSATQRQLYKVIGGQQADVAGAGFAESGSAVDIMRDSSRQGSLQKSLLDIQGTVNSNAYSAQAGAYMGEYQAAESAAKAADAGGVMNTIGGIVGIAAMFSDRRLKTDIRRIGQHRGLPVYRFRYLWDRAVQIGFMADEVARLYPRAVLVHPSGFKLVDYGRVG